MSRKSLIFVSFFLITAVIFLHRSLFKTKPSSEKIYQNFNALVFLEVVYQNDKLMIGSLSGFLINIDGEPFVISAGHLIRQNGPDSIKEVTAFFKNDFEPQSLKLVGYDIEIEDISLFSFERESVKRKLLPYCAKIGDSDELKAGQQVFSLGADLDIQFSFAAGHIKNLDLGSVYNPTSIRMGSDLYFQPQLISHDANVNPGSSGGPLLNECGAVVGVNQMIRLVNRPGAQGYALASLINDVVKVIRIIKKEGEITYADLPFLVGETRLIGNYELFNLGILRPQKNSPVIVYVAPEYADSGLREGDLIRFYQKEKVKSANEVMRSILIDSRPGETVFFTIERGGELKTIELKLKPKENKNEKCSL